jgi:hypothetical protein
MGGKKELSSRSPDFGAVQIELGDTVGTAN